MDLVGVQLESFLTELIMQVQMIELTSVKAIGQAGVGVKETVGQRGVKRLLLNPDSNLILIFKFDAADGGMKESYLNLNMALLYEFQFAQQTQDTKSDPGHLQEATGAEAVLAGDGGPNVGEATGEASVLSATPLPQDFKFRNSVQSETLVHDQQTGTRRTIIRPD